MAARMWTLECEPSFQNAGWERMSEPESRLCACSFETASSTCESARREDEMTRSYVSSASSFENSFGSHRVCTVCATLSCTPRRMSTRQNTNASGTLWGRNTVENALLAATRTDGSGSKRPHNHGSMSGLRCLVICFFTRLARMVCAVKRPSRTLRSGSIATVSKDNCHCGKARAISSSVLPPLSSKYAASSASAFILVVGSFLPSFFSASAMSASRSASTAEAFGSKAAKVSPVPPPPIAATMAAALALLAEGFALRSPLSLSLPIFLLQDAANPFFRVHQHTQTPD
mmetsp:Transcript_34422/g.82105  ORF Transcript_34422/g.82105 Transcript_34422/m.82105 type:complete len:288 (-) Transcript_34422:110-973(-)